MSIHSPLVPNYPPGVQTDTIDGASVPWRFGDVAEEYRALREGVGVFDLSPFGRLEVSGRGAQETLQWRLSREIGYLADDRSIIALLLEDNGEPADVVAVSRQPGGYIVETAPGRTDRCRDLLASSGGADVNVEESTRVATIGLEGPFAWQVIGREIDARLTGLAYQASGTAEVEGSSVRVSRSGFTGEYGYKITGDEETITSLWRRFTDDHCAVGYDVLERAMLEVRHPVVRRELTPGATVVSAGLNWLVELDKPEFAGRSAIEEQAQHAVALPIGFTGGPIDVAEGAAVLAEDIEVGEVAFTIDSPGLGATLGLARLDPTWHAAGVDLEIATNGDRNGIRTLSSPYVIPKSWSVQIT
jgi:glycine cleavage system aminomethyltransferase T